jgi:hypothetical protein
MKEVRPKGYPIQLCTVLWLSLHYSSTIEPSRCIWCNKIIEEVTFNPCANRFYPTNPLGVRRELVTHCVRERLDR